MRTYKSAKFVCSVVNSSYRHKQTGAKPKGRHRSEKRSQEGNGIYDHTEVRTRRGSLKAWISSEDVSAMRGGSLRSGTLGATKVRLRVLRAEGTRRIRENIYDQPSEGDIQRRGLNKTINQKGLNPLHLAKIRHGV